jgi:hypothetical protein
MFSFFVVVYNWHGIISLAEFVACFQEVLCELWIIIVVCKGMRMFFEPFSKLQPVRPVYFLPQLLHVNWYTPLFLKLSPSLVFIFSKDWREFLLLNSTRKSVCLKILEIWYVALPKNVKITHFWSFLKLCVGCNFGCLCFAKNYQCDAGENHCYVGYFGWLLFHLLLLRDSGGMRLIGL